MDLVCALDKAACADPTLRENGEKELESFETSPGFYTALLSVYSNGKLPSSTRSLAIIYLKNAVERNWRKSNVFSTVEKNSLKDQLLNCILIPSTTASKQMAKQLAVIIASIARSDFPRSWPNLITFLNETVLKLAEKASLSKLNATLIVICQVFKKLSTARIGQARILLNEISVTHIELYWHIFTTFDNYEALKIVGILLYSGNDRSHRFEGPKRVFHEISISLLCSSRYFHRVGKVFCRFVENYPLAFCGFGEDAAKVSKFYCDFLNSRPQMGPVVQAMCFTRDLTRVIKLNDALETNLPLNLRPRDDQDRSDLRDAFQTLRGVFERPLINALTNNLIQFYFRMTEEDISLWRNDPGEFFLEESKQNPEYSVVLCAEMLFAHLIKTWPDEVANQAKLLIENSVVSGEELAIEGSLRALEFGAPVFSQSFAVEPVIQLLISNTSPLIRRRLCFVVGSWVAVKTSSNLQTLAFDLITSTLENPHWDMVVRLGALDLAGACCSDIDFNADSFTFSGDIIFERIFYFLQDVGQSTDVKLHVLNVLGAIIEGIGPKFEEKNMQQVLHILPSLWEVEIEHSTHHLIQGSVLQALAHLVSASGSRCQPCFEVAIPFCEIATDPHQPVSSYLMEDALTLWRALLSNAPERQSTGIALLSERLISLIESKTEYLGLLLSILEGYLWLDYQLILPFAQKLMGLFSIYLEDGCALDEALLILLCVEVLCITSFRSTDIDKIIVVMEQTGLFQWVVGRVLQAGQPVNKGNGMDVSILGGKCLNILSLLTIRTQGQIISEHRDAVMASCLSLSKSVADPRDRKLVCMGFISLLLVQPDLFNRFSNDVMQIIASVVEEIPDTAGVEHLFGLHLESEEDSLMSAEEKRKRRIQSEEFAVSTGLRCFISNVCHELRQRGFPEMIEQSVQIGIISV